MPKIEIWEHKGNTNLEWREIQQRLLRDDKTKACPAVGVEVSQ